MPTVNSHRCKRCGAHWHSTVVRTQANAQVRCHECRSWNTSTAWMSTELPLESNNEEMRAFIAKIGITITFEPTQVNPYWTAKDDKHSRLHWLAKLVVGERSMTTFYTTGEYYHSYYKRYRATSFFENREWSELTIIPPSPSDLLGCLAMDARGIWAARDFESWATEVGYDTDSRKAERTYHTVREQVSNFESLIGRLNLEELMRIEY